MPKEKHSACEVGFACTHSKENKCSFHWISQMHQDDKRPCKSLVDGQCHHLLAKLRSLQEILPEVSLMGSVLFSKKDWEKALKDVTLRREML